MELLCAINEKGTAIMLVTHDAKVAAMAKRVLFMKDGEIVKEVKFSDYSGMNRQRKMELLERQMRDIGI